MKNSEENKEMSSDKPQEVKTESNSRSFSAMRANPWMPASIVLAIVLVLVIFLNGFGGTGNVVSGSEAGDNLVSFINSQGNGDAEVVSTSKEGNGFYQVTVNYNGQDIPVYVTLDGKYLVSDLVPLTGNTVNTNTGATASNEPVDVKVGDSPQEGNKDAKVTIVEFTDFQCPYCEKYYSETYVKLKKDYIDTGKVSYYLMNFPLGFHDEAQKAAESGLCVRAQKGDTGYWKMHDKLFENQGSLSVANYKKWARELGVDGAKFDKCLDDGEFEDKVKEDLAYGQTIGVQGTPAFFVNGVLLSGAQPYSAFQKAIDAALTENSSA